MMASLAAEEHASKVLQEITTHHIESRVGQAGVLDAEFIREVLVRKFSEIEAKCRERVLAARPHGGGGGLDD